MLQHAPSSDQREKRPLSKKTVVVLIDDIDGTEAVENHTFMLHGTSHEIDLSADNATKFRSALEPRTAAARRTVRRSARRGVSSSGATSTQIRAWATARGILRFRLAAVSPLTCRSSPVRPSDS